MSVPLGYVAGRYVEPITSQPAVGEVRFTLLVARGDVQAEEPTRVIPRRVAAPLVDGVLAPTALAVGRYEVSFSLVGVSLPKFVTDVSPSHTEEAPLDLNLAAPLIPTVHERFVVNELVYREALEAAAAAALTAADVTASAAEVTAAVAAVEAASAAATTGATDATTGAASAASAAASALASASSADSAATVAQAARDKVETFGAIHAVRTVMLSSDPHAQREYPTLHNSLDTPILTHAQAGSNSLYWPCLVDRWMINPALPADVRYALYWSTDHDASHAATGAFMATAASPLGPWTVTGRVFRDDTPGVQQCETPTVVPDAANNRWLMFYQVKGAPGAVADQATCVATSPDGVTWTRVGVAFDSPGAFIQGALIHSGYVRVWRKGGRWFAINLGGGSHYGHLLWRCTGNDPTTGWKAVPSRLSRSGPQINHFANYSEVDTLWKWPYMNIVNWRGREWGLATVGATSAGGQEVNNAIGVAPLTPDYMRLGGPAVDITPAPQAWMTTGIDDWGLGITTEGHTYVPFRANGKTGAFGIVEVL